MVGIGQQSDLGANLLERRVLFGCRAAVADFDAQEFDGSASRDTVSQLEPGAERAHDANALNLRVRQVKRLDVAIVMEAGGDSR